MIRYRLVCERAHEFDSWFRNLDAFERASAAGELVCPVCGSGNVEKTLMAPAVATGQKRSRAEAPADAEPAASTMAQSWGNTMPAMPAEMLETLRRIKRDVVENADYVGSRFAEEARRIHYKETKARGIYGEATQEDARGLLEEGIEFYPLPTLPDERN